jgi:uncharacterized membrane protein YeiH
MDQRVAITFQELARELDIPVYAHLVAFFLFGLSGGLAALKRHYDFIGLFALAFATAAGGGLIRDGLFIQGGPALITQNSDYILVILASAIAAVLFRRSILRLGKIIAWLDAFGLGVYTVIGIQKSLLAGLSTAAAVVVGVISAAGGGLLRDLLTGDEPLMFKPGQFYIMAALAGCGVYLGCLGVAALSPYAVGLSIGVTFVIRILAIQFNWTTVPVSHWDRSAGGEGI